MNSCNQACAPWMWANPHPNPPPLAGEGRVGVGHQALVVDVHAQVMRDVLAARVVQSVAVRTSYPRAA